MGHSRVTFSGYTDVELDVDIDDVLASLDDEHIIEEANDRGLFNEGDVIIDTSIELPFLDNHKDNNRRKLCKLLDMNMHTSKEAILNFINNKL